MDKFICLNVPVCTASRIQRFNSFSRSEPRKLGLPTDGLSPSTTVRLHQSHNVEYGILYFFEAPYIVILPAFTSSHACLRFCFFCSLNFVELFTGLTFLTTIFYWNELSNDRALNFQVQITSRMRFHMYSQRLI